MGSLFDDDSAGLSANEAIGDGAVILRRFLGADTDAVVRAIDTIAHAAPFREMATPGGHLMSVEMTNCGAVGWVTDRSGYRYSPTDRLTGNPWPSMPPLFVDLALRAARQAGFDGFLPDCCLINRYSPGARMSLHQARDERDFDAPIVSVSLGLPAMFLFGGQARSDKPKRVRLSHGDVVVWGGPARLAFHRVSPLAEGIHPDLARRRINLTFRKAL